MGVKNGQGSGLALLVSLIASGLMMCASMMELSDEDIRAKCESQKVNPDIGLGISLGMTFSSAVVFTDSFCTGNHDLMKIPMNDLGITTMPSCIAFTHSGDVLIGDLAKDQQHLNPRRTICGLNRLIGKNYSGDNDDDYKVVIKQDRPHVEVEFELMKVVFSVEEICGMLLGKIKEMAEAYTGKRIQLAVVAFDDQSNESTPSTSIGECFDDHIVKRRIVEAGEMVGLEIVDIWDCSYVGTELARRLWLMARRNSFDLFFDRMVFCGFSSPATTPPEVFRDRKQ